MEPAVSDGLWQLLVVGVDAGPIPQSELSADAVRKPANDAGLLGWGVPSVPCGQGHEEGAREPPEPLVWGNASEGRSC